METKKKKNSFLKQPQRNIVIICLFLIPIINILFLQEYQKVVDVEWKILYEKLDAIVKSGAQVVLSKLPIGDVATQYFADR